MMRSSLKGFTLIELLVVITIISVLLSLVAPLMIEQVDKTKAAAEYQQLEEYISGSAKVAFLRAQKAHFLFEGKRLYRTIGSEQTVVDFNYLFFSKQGMTISSNGFFDSEHINVIKGNSELTLDLERLM